MAAMGAPILGLAALIVLFAHGSAYPPNEPGEPASQCVFRRDVLTLTRLSLHFKTVHLTTATTAVVFDLQTTTLTRTTKTTISDTILFYTTTNIVPEKVVVGSTMTRVVSAPSMLVVSTDFLSVTTFCS